jgi:GNAT superfamily N-acetyltransferase
MGHQTGLVIAELSADATWTADESMPLGPWKLRATQGYSHRANSVRTIAEQATSLPWDGLIAEAETFYRQHGLPAIFHISPATVPPDLDQRLSQRGYVIEKGSEVYIADPALVRDATARLDSPGQIIIRDDPDEAWLSCALDETIGPKKIRERICRRVPAPRAFVSIIEGQRTIARALGAVSLGIGWVYCMATVPDRQRRGCATQLLNFLAQWSLKNGAEMMCLQVFSSNFGARRLYTNAGFTKRYDYHYRVQHV